MFRPKVYISSTYRDMVLIRQLIKKTIQDVLPEHFELSKVMETMDADTRGGTDINYCIEEVRSADVYILLLGKRYGSSPGKYKKNNDENDAPNTEMLSYTEIEFHAATRAGSEIIVFEIAGDFFPNEKLDHYSDLQDAETLTRYSAFVEKIKTNNRCRQIESAISMQGVLQNSLAQYYFKENLALQLNPTISSPDNIDRTDAIGVVDNFNKFHRGERCVVFYSKYMDDSDCPERFYARLKQRTKPRMDAPYVFSEYELLLIEGNVMNYHCHLKGKDILFAEHTGYSEPAYDEFWEEKRGTPQYFGCKITAHDENYVTALCDLIEVFKGFKFNHPFIFFISIEEHIYDTVFNVIEGRLSKMAVRMDYLGVLGPIEKDDIVKWIEPLRNNTNTSAERIFKRKFNDGDYTPHQYLNVLKKFYL